MPHHYDVHETQNANRYHQGCDNGGGAFMCSSQSPWAINDTVSYGFAAVKLAGSSEQQWCCQCYELTFTSGPVKGKKFVIQAVNTGG